MPTRLALALCLASLVACGPSALLQCRLDAVSKLPPEPLAVNGHDVANLVARLQTCQPPEAGDAGAK